MNLSPGQSICICIPTAVHAQNYRPLGRTGRIEFILEWLERWRQMRTLVALDSRLLTDIGQSRDAAVHEMAQAFWRTYSQRHLR